MTADFTSVSPWAKPERNDFSFYTCMGVRAGFDLWAWERKFDVVFAGAIVEHISDPIPFLTNLAGLANEAVIIAFTPVLPTLDLVLQAMNSWDDPAFN